MEENKIGVSPEPSALLRLEENEEVTKSLFKSRKEKSYNEKLKSWLKNKYNFYFLGILIFAIALRLYYFFLTADQPVWWDEGEYLSFGNSLAFNIPYEISPQRVVLFPFLISLLFKIGFTEVLVKFILVLVPSILVVLVTYLFVKDLYNERIALVTSFLTTIFWIHLFYSLRVMNDEIGFLFGLLGWFLFYKGYLSGKNNKLVYLSAFFFALTFLMRPAGIFYPATIFVFLLFTDKFKMFTKKELWMMPVIFFLALVPHLIWSHFYHGSALAFQGAYGGTDGNPLGWNVFNMVAIYLNPTFNPSSLIEFSNILLLFFIIGLFTLIPLFLSFDKLLFNKYKKYYNDLFIVLSFIFVLGVAIFVLRKFEDRWLMAFSLAIFVLTAKGIFLISDSLKKHIGKTFIILLIVAVLLLGTYIHISHADSLIKNRLTSYGPVKDSGIWIKENSNPEDKVFSMSFPQHSYYTERETLWYPYSDLTEGELKALLRNEEPRFYVVSIFERHDQFVYDLPNKYPEAFSPVRVYQQQEGEPFLVVYEIDNEIFNTNSYFVVK
jgi:hypothetical protein